MELAYRDSGLKILLLEDGEEDYFLLTRTLSKDGLEFEASRVDTLHGLEAALLNGECDLVISDFNLPGFNALEALKTVKEARPEVPFIVVSGSIGEEQAVELIRHGASDYLMKDRLARLTHVVRRELREVQLRERQRRLEREVRHLQKIEALGSLAGGIAHNFRNVLMAVRGLGEIASTKLPADHPASEDLSQMLEATQRTERLVDKIMRFSRRDPAQAIETIDLHECVVNALAMLRPTLPSMIQCFYDGRPGCLCRAAADDVEQIQLNLCTNAAQAIGHRPGRIHIILDRYSNNDAGAGLLAPGEYCRLRVIDDGPGMTADVREHIFEPFFTTKAAGEGTGLGLAMVQRTLTELGGGVTCLSEPGGGATFELFFPHTQTVAEQTGFAERIAPDLGHGERIMLVDDEQILANLAAAFLAQAGYTVTKFYDPTSALSAFRAQPGDYDILLTDLAMPAMTGVELASEMRTLKPQLPVILCTGFSGDPGTLMHKHCDVVLSKPCGRLELYRAVRDALATKTPHSTGSAGRAVA